MNATKYTITPDGRIYEVREVVENFRKTPRGWIHDPHVSGLAVWGVPRLRAPFMDLSGPILGVLREALESKGQFVPFEDLLPGVKGP